MARSVKLSPSRLRSLFREEVGVSFQQCLKARRLLKAKKLLETTFFNVQEVMKEVGLKDKSHFSRDFKKAYGSPPLRYRAEYLAERKKNSRR